MPKFKTVAFDSAGEVARLFFSWDMKKKPGDFETIRQVNNYTGTSERLNMFIRRMKDLRKMGVEVVFTAHTDIQKIYAKGGAITARGQTPQEAIAVKGQPDLPGNRTPDEFVRACDNLFRVRNVNGVVKWVSKPEPLGGGGDDWLAKDRFNAPLLDGGFLPPSYAEIAEKCLAHPILKDLWQPPYIWCIYGNPGMKKTRSLLTFPRPIKIFDLDGGCKVIAKEAKDDPENIVIDDSINCEDSSHYERFLAEVAACLR